jgi:IS4 transposase
MDRGYIDFRRLFVFTFSSAFFVVRTKSNVLIQRRYSHPVDKTTGVRSDQTVILTSFESASAYPDALRRINYLDMETHKRLKFLPNNFVLPAFTIAQIYKCRWQVDYPSSKPGTGSAPATRWLSSWWSSIPVTQ